MNDPDNVVPGITVTGTMAMHKAHWLTLLLLGPLVSMTGFADNARVSGASSETRAVEAVSAEQVVALPKYESRWLLLPLVEDMADAYDRPPPITNLLFQDMGAFARVSRFRYLSLLTLAQSGQTRLFLGVNEHGLMGLHYGAFPRRKDDSHLELVRMPYLKNAETGYKVP